MTDLAHAIQFLQTTFTILLSLAFGESFRQLVPDVEKDIRWNRLYALLAFIFMIFPFFHGMTRYFFKTYLSHANDRLAPVAFLLMFDGIMFMTMSAMFFVMSRSLAPSHWIRFFASLALLLIVDSIWIGVSIVRGAELWPWIILNGALGAALICLFFTFRKKPLGPGPFSFGPTGYCAIATFLTTVADYVWMRHFYFD
jgi:hypothetical protein